VDPDQIERLDPGPLPHQNDKLDPDQDQFADDKPLFRSEDPDLHQIEKGTLGSGSGSASK
jgi:hypothetical protein